MAKIIPFGRPESAPTRTSIAIAKLQGAVDASRLEQEFQIRGLGIDVTFRIRLHLDLLCGHVSLNSVCISRNILKNMSTADLVSIAERSNEIQWNARPGYFRALVDEIKSR